MRSAARDLGRSIRTDFIASPLYRVVRPKPVTFAVEGSLWLIRLAHRPQKQCLCCQAHRATRGARSTGAKDTRCGPLTKRLWLCMDRAIRPLHCASYRAGLLQTAPSQSLKRTHSRNPRQAIGWHPRITIADALALSCGLPQIGERSRSAARDHRRATPPDSIASPLYRLVRPVAPIIVQTTDRAHPHQCEAVRGCRCCIALCSHTSHKKQQRTY